MYTVPYRGQDANHWYILTNRLVGNGTSENLIVLKTNDGVQLGKNRIDHKFVSQIDARLLVDRYFESTSVGPSL